MDLQTPPTDDDSFEDRHRRDPSSSPLSVLSRSPSPPSKKPSPVKPLPASGSSFTIHERVAPTVAPILPTQASSRPSPKPLLNASPNPSDPLSRAPPSRSSTPKKEGPQSEKNQAPRSSRRNRKPPSHLQNGLDDDFESDGSPVKKVKLSQSNVGRKRLPIRSNWSAEFLLQNPKSKIATINLMELLSSDKAWSSLEREQQLKLISMLPNACVPELSDSESLPNVPKEFLKTNRSMQADVRLFQEDLKEGRHEPSWQQSAAEAMEKRADGEYDNWKEQNREEFWGQKQKTIWDARAGDSAQYTLVNLVAAGCFEVGDVWSMRRGMGHGKNAVVVEKEARIISIAPNHTLTFRYAPGTQKHSAGRMDVEVDNVASPKALSDAIIREDGRIPSTVRGPNAWLEFRCMRRNQDLGSIWDVRELHHKKIGN